jgi:hypothetical protein
MNEALVKCLNNVGKPTEELRCPDGSTLLVLPYGGRVLGLYASGSSENFLWTNPVLNKPESAKAFYASDEWHNSGGDRTWLAPEADLFFPDFPDLKRYFQQRSLDPGRYEASKTAAGLRLVNRLTCTLSRAKCAVDLEISKTLSPAANPLRYERTARELLKLEDAGYMQQTSLAMIGESVDTPVQVGAWNLLQMPHGGELLVPVYAKTQPLIVFGDIPPEDLTASDRLVRYRMRSLSTHKISVRAVATAGRVGYTYSTGKQSVLVVRNFFVNPSGEYVDAPWTDMDDLGYSVQACNVVEERLGHFSELEYHIPAVGQGTGRTRCDDWSQVWAFRGPSELVRAAARFLLSVEA